MKVLAANRGTLAWAGLSGMFIFAAVLVHSLPATALPALSWQAGLWRIEPWRQWSAAWVHWSAWHLGANVLGALVLMAAAQVSEVRPRHAAAWLVAWPLTHLLLACDPALAQYGGMSGVLHAGVAIVIIALLDQSAIFPRVTGLVLLAALLIKLAREAPLLAHALGWHVPPLPLPGTSSFVVAGNAHLAGTLAGLACGLWLGRRP